MLLGMRSNAPEVPPKATARRQSQDRLPPIARLLGRAAAHAAIADNCKALGERTCQNFVPIDQIQSGVQDDDQQAVQDAQAAC